MATATKKIDDKTLNVLKHGSWEDGAFRITTELDRKTYLNFMKVMEAFGGKWNRHSKSIKFEDGEAEAAVRMAAQSGEYMDLKKLYQFFETPDEVADNLVRQLGLSGECTVLEPSAGHGALIRALARACTDATGEAIHVNATAVEIDSAKCKKLQLLTGAPGQVLMKLVQGADFTALGVRDLGLFDYVVMNPPFAKSQDMEHVRHAINFVKPGGKLATIMSPGFTFRSDKKATEFREWLDERIMRGEAHCEELPPQSFKSSGTNVSTVRVVITRPSR